MKRRLLLLFAATLSFAADLPKYSGYVNDFAGRLTANDRDALEAKLRDYERTTTNEVAVAIVESLDGLSVDAYARRLFHEWGIGKKDRNNGVLFLWAPVERKVRIEVGYGLEGTLSDQAAAEILRDVTARFRNEDYAAGLNAGVDGIIGRLSGVEPSRRSWAVLVLPLLVAAGVLCGLIVLVRVARKNRLTYSLPKDLARATEAMKEAEALRAKAVDALTDLRREAPPEVWSPFEEVPNAAPELAKLYHELHEIQSQPRESLREMSHAHHMLKRWNGRFSTLWERLEGTGKQLDAYRYCREQAPRMLRETEMEIAAQETGWGFGSRAKLVEAARETCSRAASVATAEAVNWLLVYDLVRDARDCLKCARGSSGYRRQDRYWGISAGYSPAYDLLIAQTATESSSDFGGGGSSGGSDSGGSFGGGDSGGGGASSSY